VAVKRDLLRLSQHTWIETGRDMSGRFWVAYTNCASTFHRDAASLRKFLKIPKGIPMRESLDSWLISLADMDQERVSKRAEPLTSEAPTDHTSSSLSQELLATGFGPECHDEEDPALSTKMVL
jgi:hypothetical protein